MKKEQLENELLREQIRELRIRNDKAIGSLVPLSEFVEIKNRLEQIKSLWIEWGEVSDNAKEGVYHKLCDILD